MRRREFLQVSAGTGAASVISRPLWADAAGPAKAIRQPSKDFLATLPHLMELAQLPGLGIGVVEGGKVWQHCAGVSNRTTNAPITPSSLFPAASMGKQCFAFGALLLAEEGKLDLDKPLKQYLDDGAPTGKWSEKITARHVLSHSSGLMNWRDDRDQELTPAFEPGTKFRYSGEGFYCLQRCVEHITGVGFEQWMQDRVMRPLGMKSSTYFYGERMETHGSWPVTAETNRSTTPRFAKKLFTLIEAKWKASGGMASRRDCGRDAAGQPRGLEALAERDQPERRLQFTNDGRGLFSLSGACCVAPK